MINKLINNIKAMAKKKEVSKEETKVKPKAPAKAVEKTKEKVEVASPEIPHELKNLQPKKESKKVGDELTQEILDKAISIHSVSSSSNLPWDEITQEERYEFIKQAKASK